MAGDPDKSSSPACSLDEADDLYRGFLPPAEIQQHIDNWISKAPSINIATLLSNLQEQPRRVERATAMGNFPAKISRAQMQREIYALLPKIRDDRMHQALQEIARKL